MRIVIIYDALGDWLGHLQNMLIAMGYDVSAGEEPAGVDKLIESGVRPDILITDEAIARDIDRMQSIMNSADDREIPVVFVKREQGDFEISDEFVNRSYGIIPTEKPDSNFLKSLMKYVTKRFREDRELGSGRKKLQLANHIFEILNHSGTMESTISDIVYLIQKFMNYDIVSIRLIGKDRMTPGLPVLFSEEFSVGDDGETAAMCIDCPSLQSHYMDVLGGAVDREQLHYTSGGSFWSNSHTCIGMDNAPISVALVPLHDRDTVIGVLHICCRHQNALPLDMVKFFEWISSSIGTSVAHMKTYDLLMESEMTLNHAQQIARIGSWINRIGETTYRASRMAKELFFVDPDKPILTLDDILRHVHPDDVEIVRKTREDGRRSMVGYSHDVRLLKDDELRHVNITAEPVFRDGECVEFIGTIQDITNTKLVIQEIIENRAFLDSVLTGIEATILITEPDTRVIVYANGQGEKLLRMPYEEIIGMVLDDFVHEDVHEADAAEQTGWQTDITLRLRDDVYIPVNKQVIPVTWQGRPHHAVIMFDMTDRKMLERQLNHAQKMESIGQLAAGIAHEINTPIQYVGDNLTFLEGVLADLLDLYGRINDVSSSLPPDTALLVEEILGSVDYEFIHMEVPLAVKQAREGVNRVATIVRAMKNFSHPGVEERTLVDINASITNTVTVARNEWKYVADVKTDLDEHLPHVLGHPDDLNQVFLNLLVNAAHAIEDFGARDNADDGIIAIKTRASQGNVFITFADNGGGIPEKIRNRIFDPFFTTKSVGKGTGQGLSICHDIIVDKHGGVIDFESEVGKGTVFTVVLPQGGEQT